MTKSPHEMADTLNQQWSKDTSKFGFKMLEKMGWSEGKGAGKNEDGMASHIKVSRRPSAQGLGTVTDDAGNAAFVGQIDGFNAVLKSLNASIANTRNAGGEDGEERKQKKKKSKKAKKDKKEKKESRKRAREQADGDDGDLEVGDVDGDEAETDADAEAASRKKSKKERKEKKKKKKEKKRRRQEVAELAVERKANARLSRAKDTSKYSASDMAAILGVA